jgi:hypothetical protein
MWLELLAGVWETDFLTTGFNGLPEALNFAVRFFEEI